MDIPVGCVGRGVGRLTDCTSGIFNSSSRMSEQQRSFIPVLVLLFFYRFDQIFLTRWK